MQRKQEADLLPLDTEIERTLKILRKTTCAENRSMANQIERLHAIPEEDEVETPLRSNNTMEDFWRLII